MQILLINKSPNSPDYDKSADQITVIQKQRDDTEQQLGRQQDIVQEHVDLQNFITNHSKKLEHFDEHLVRHLIKKITVYETYYDVEFKNGDSVKINL